VIYALWRMCCTIGNGTDCVIYVLWKVLYLWKQEILCDLLLCIMEDVLYHWKQDRMCDVCTVKDVLYHWKQDRL
jgi:hypothetical protein